MKNLGKVLALAATLGTSGAVLAQADMNELWKSLDTDQDGLVSQEEAAASGMVTEQWKVLDANSNGMLSPSEFSRLGVDSEE